MKERKRELKGGERGREEERGEKRREVEKVRSEIYVQRKKVDGCEGRKVTCIKIRN